MSDVLPVLALAAAFAGTWGLGWVRARRFRRATAEAAARLDGRYEPGSHVSGGTLFLRVDGRDVVIDFFLGSTRRGPSSTALATLAQVRETELLLRGRAALERAPRLRAFRGLFGWGLELGAASNRVWVKVPRVVRDGPGLVELASLTAALAAELER